MREFRKRLRMTQEELAAGICNRSYVSQIEKGQVIPSPEILEQLAKRLQVELGELWTESPNPSFTQVEIQNALRHVIGRIEEKEWEIARKWLMKLNGARLSPVDEGIFFWAKGKLAETDGRTAEVEPLYLKSLSLTRGHDDVIPYIRTLDSLGSFYSDGGQPEKAISCLNEAFQLVNRFDVHGLLRISVHYHLGKMHAKLGEYRSAIEQLNNAEALNHLYETFYKSGDILMLLGICHLNTRQYEQAETCLRQAVTIWQLRSEQNRLADAYVRLGVLYREREAYDLALEHLRHAIALCDQPERQAERHQAMLEVAIVCQRAGRLEEATQACQSVMESGDKRLLAQAELVLADILCQSGQAEAALSHLENARNYFTLTGEREWLQKTYLLLGKVASRNGRYEQAARMYESSLVLLLA